MKNITKKTFALSICLLILSVLLTSSSLVLAQDVTGTSTPKTGDETGSSTPKISDPFKNPNLAVKIPGLNFRKVHCEETEGGENCYVPWVADYIQGLYVYGISLISILAVVAMMIAGVIWLTAGGNSQKISEAKKWIGSSLTGLVIAFSSYIILNIINPALTELSPLKITTLIKEDLPDKTEYDVFINNESISELKVAPTNIVKVQIETTTGTKTVQVDETIAELMKKTFKEVKDAGFPIYEVGGYRESKYCHGRGLAIDVNVDENYCIDCYSKKGALVGKYYRPTGVGAGKDYTVDKNSFTKELVDIFKRNGWCWGGDWKSFKDYMHFSVPTCRNGAECGASGRYDFGQSVKSNHQKYGITYP